MKEKGLFQIENNFYMIKYLDKLAMAAFTAMATERRFLLPGEKIENEFQVCMEKIAVLERQRLFHEERSGTHIVAWKWRQKSEALLPVPCPCSLGKHDIALACQCWEWWGKGSISPISGRTNVSENRDPW